MLNPTFVLQPGIALTTTTIHRAWYHLCLLLLVRLGGYITNLSDFYSYRFIGKLTVFFQLQEFSLRNTTVDCSTSAARHTLFSSSQNAEIYYPHPRIQIVMFRPIRVDPSINLVFIFRCSSSTTNPVSVRRVDSSVLVFSLSS
jgi:hypothetical protein